MKKKVLKKIILICLVLISIFWAYTIFNLSAENTQLKQDYKALDKRLENVEAEWDSVHVLTTKITELAPPKVDRLSKKKLGFYIHYFGKKYQESEIIKDIMISLPYIESTYYKYAVGLAGELGYYQIHPIHNLDMTRVFDEDYQVENAYKILMRNVERHGELEHAVNGYNGWPSTKNPYYGKVVIQLAKLKNI